MIENNCLNGIPDSLTRTEMLSLKQIEERYPLNSLPEWILKRIIHANLDGHHEKWIRKQNHRFAKHESRFSEHKRELVRLRYLKRYLKSVRKGIGLNAPSAILVEQDWDLRPRYFSSAMYSPSLPIRLSDFPVQIFGSSA